MTLLSKVISTAALKKQDIRGAVYVRPSGLGVHVVTLIGSTEELTVFSVLGIQTFAPGEIVTLGIRGGRGGYVLLGGAPPGSLGSSAFPPSSGLQFSTDAILITGVSPSELLPGVEAVVDVFGYGFLPGDAWSIVDLSETPGLEPTIDPYLTITAAELLDPIPEEYSPAAGQTAFRLTISATPDAKAGHRASIGVSRSTAATLAPDALLILGAEGSTADYLAFFEEFFLSGSYGLAHFLGGSFSDLVTRVSATDPGASLVAVSALRGAPGVGAESACAFLPPVDPAPPSILVIDGAETPALHSWQPSDGFGATPPVVGSDGTLYWVEFEIGWHSPSVYTLRIWSSSADLGAPVMEFEDDLAIPTFEGHGFVCPRITSTDLYFLHSYLVDSAVTCADFRWPLSGGTLADHTSAWESAHGTGAAGITEYSLYGVLSESGGCSYLAQGSVFFQPVSAAPYLVFDVARNSLDYLDGSGAITYSDYTAERFAAASAGSALETITVENVQVDSDTVGPLAFFYRSP